MDDPSLLPFLNNNNNNGNGHHYSIDMEEDIEHEEDELDEEDEDLHEQQYPEDEIEEDEIDDDDLEDDDEREIHRPPPQPPQQIIQLERGGRRKGTPRRLQLSPQRNKVPVVGLPHPRLLPSTSSKASSSNAHHHEQQQPILTSDQEEEEEFNNENGLPLEYLPSNFLDDDEYDENNNMNYNDEENVSEIVDDILADIVTIIVRDVRQQRQQKTTKQRLPQTNGHSKSKSKILNGKDLLPSSNSSKSPSKLPSDSSILFNEFTKMMHLNSQQQLVKHKQSPSSSTFSSPPSAKRQKISSDTSGLSLQQHQQLLWQMTQQLMMSTQANETDTSSLLKQQLLGLTPPGTIPKRVGRPPKQQQVQPPQVMRSSTNMHPPTSHSLSNTSPFDRGTNFAPRRRGRPPKYVTERAAIPGLPSHDLDPTSYDQLFAAIENSVTGNASRTSSATFQSALASMLGHQSGLSIPPPPIPPPVNRNGAPASMVKQSAGQTRHSLPASMNGSKLPHGLEMPLMATKKRGPGRPPKSQTLIDSHQVLQATKRMNSSLTNSNNLSNNFPPTMVPSSPSSFNLNAAFVEMLQQQQHPR